MCVSVKTKYVSTWNEVIHLLYLHVIYDKVICVELDKNTAFNTYGVICLPRSLSVYTGDRTRSHKTIAKKDSIRRLAIVA